MSAGVYDYPISRIRKTAPFLIEGMVYGWEFSYTPQDNARGVEETLEITEIVPSENFLRLISFSSVWFEKEDNELSDSIVEALASKNTDFVI